MRAALRELALAPDLRARIEREARAAVPRECCGLIVGSIDAGTARVAALYASRNLAEDVDRFEIDPQLQFALLRELRGTKRSVVGCYHSHPAGRAEPSARDSASPCEEGFIWLIQGTEDLRAYVRESEGFSALALA